MQKQNSYDMHYRLRYDTVEITTPRKKDKLYFSNSRSAKHTKFGIEIEPISGTKYTVDEWGIRHW